MLQSEVICCVESLAAGVIFTIPAMIILDNEDDDGLDAWNHINYGTTIILAVCGGSIYRTDCLLCRVTIAYPLSNIHTLSHTPSTHTTCSYHLVYHSFIMTHTNPQAHWALFFPYPFDVPCCSRRTLLWPSQRGWPVRTSSKQVRTGSARC